MAAAPTAHRRQRHDRGSPQPAAYGISPSADALGPDLAKLRDQAGSDVPVIASHVGKLTTEILAGYRDLGIEHVTVDLPTQPRDETLRRLDALHTAYAELG